MDEVTVKVEDAIQWALTALALLAAVAALLRTRIVPLAKKIAELTPTDRDDAVVAKLDEVLELLSQPEGEVVYERAEDDDPDDDDKGGYDA